MNSGGSHSRSTSALGQSLSPPLLILVAVGLAATSLGLCLTAVTQLIGNVGAGPVYSVSALRANLTRNPSAWVGRTVLVRGDAEYCTSLAIDHNPGCGTWETTLVDPQNASTLGSLPLLWGAANQLFAALRRLPLIARVVPAPQEPWWGTVTTYRVQLRAASSELCGASTCVALVLLDADPANRQGE